MSETITIPREEWEQTKATAEAALIVAAGLLYKSAISMESEELRAFHEKLPLLSEGPFPIPQVGEKIRRYLQNLEGDAPSDLYDADSQRGQ